MAESRFLQSLPPDVLTSLIPDLTRIDMPRGEGLHMAGEVAEFAYFPTSCLVSLVVTLENGSAVEAATIGNDGFVGLSAFLGVEHADLTAITQIEGEALRIKMDAFRKHLEDPRLREKLGEVAARTLATVAQSTACIAFHAVHQRLARWLLLVRDGMELDEFPLTHDFLAVMLGVHRPTVTLAVHQLESDGLIEHRRGLIRIIDGGLLEKAACECYRLSGWERFNR